MVRLRSDTRDRGFFVRSSDRCGRVIPGAASDSSDATIALSPWVLGLSIDFAFPTARLSERRFFTGNREWVDCELIAFITGWFVLFFVR